MLQMKMNNVFRKFMVLPPFLGQLNLLSSWSLAVWSREACWRTILYVGAFPALGLDVGPEVEVNEPPWPRAEVA